MRCTHRARHTTTDALCHTPRLTQVNWRLLYDCGALSVSLSRGDTLPGPGFSAALTATTETGGAGDSHRGAIAMALVEALRSEVAADTDFSVASSAGRDFPQGSDAWQALFEKA